MKKEILFQYFSQMNLYKNNATIARAIKNLREIADTHRKLQKLYETDEEIEASQLEEQLATSTAFYLEKNSEGKEFVQDVFPLITQ